MVGNHAYLDLAHGGPHESDVLQQAAVISILRERLEQVEGDHQSTTDWFCGQRSENAVYEWYVHAHHCLDDAPTAEDWQDFDEATGSWAAITGRRGLNEAGLRFDAWAKDTWRTSPGVLHRYVKGTPPPTLEVLAPATVADPRKIMEHHRGKWATIWTDPAYDPDELRHLFVDLQRRADEEDLPPLTVGQIMGNCAQWRPGRRRASTQSPLQTYCDCLEKPTSNSRIS